MNHEMQMQLVRSGLWCLHHICLQSKQLVQQSLFLMGRFTAQAWQARATAGTISKLQSATAQAIDHDCCGQAWSMSAALCISGLPRNAQSQLPSSCVLAVAAYPWVICDHSIIRICQQLGPAQRRPVKCTCNTIVSSQSSHHVHLMTLTFFDSINLKLQNFQRLHLVGPAFLSYGATPDP